MIARFQPRRYGFTVIARTGEGLVDFGPYVPAIDERGRVAFTSVLRDGAAAVLFGDGGALATLASSAEFRTIHSHPDIAVEGGGSGGDRKDQACFYGGGDGADRRVFRVQGAMASVVYPVAGPLGPSINREGAVAFRGVQPDGAEGVYLSRADSVVRLASIGAVYRAFHGIPMVDDSGAVTFRADLADGAEAVLRATASTLPVVLLRTGDAVDSLGFFPCANHAGLTVIAGSPRGTRAEGGWAALLVIDAERRGRVLLQLPGEGMGAVRDGGHATDAFSSFRGGLIDEAGRVVFFATPRGGRLSLFCGPDPESDLVLGQGAAFEGSVVAEFTANPVSINAEGRLALRLKLEDGRQFIVRADPEM